jgi:hypothetical protein
MRERVTKILIKTNMTRFEHTSVVLHFEKRDFAATRKDILLGLAPKSVNAMGELGNDGWELVSVIPYVAASALAFRHPGTDVAVGFFKRAKA